MGETVKLYATHETVSSAPQQKESRFFPLHFFNSIFASIYFLAFVFFYFFLFFLFCSHSLTKIMWKIKLKKKERKKTERNRHFVYTAMYIIVSSVHCISVWTYFIGINYQLNLFIFSNFYFARVWLSLISHSMHSSGRSIIILIRQVENVFFSL